MTAWRVMSCNPDGSPLCKHPLAGLQPVSACALTEGASGAIQGKKSMRRSLPRRRPGLEWPDWEGVKSTRIYRSCSIPQRVLPGLRAGAQLSYEAITGNYRRLSFPRSLPLSPPTKVGAHPGRPPTPSIDVRSTISGVTGMGPKSRSSTVHLPFRHRSSAVHPPGENVAKTAAMASKGAGYLSPTPSATTIFRTYPHPCSPCYNGLLDRNSAPPEKIPVSVENRPTGGRQKAGTVL
jgi:hypothetical protein